MRRARVVARDRRQSPRSPSPAPGTQKSPQALGRAWGTGERPLHQPAAVLDGEEVYRTLCGGVCGRAPSGALSTTRQRPRHAWGVHARCAPGQGLGQRYATTLGLDTRRRTG